MDDRRHEGLLYLGLDEIDPDELLAVLNKQRTREYLVKHDLFDSATIKEWIKDKVEVDRTIGCRVRGVISGQSLAGWCGIQLENGKYEIAIVLDPKHWGIGVRAFRDVMHWAKELGHDEIFIHLLRTRPAYKSLNKIATGVFESEWLGEQFTTYRISVKPGLTCGQ